MAGMAKSLEKCIDIPYLAELWQDSLVEDMLWMAPGKGRTGLRVMLDPNTPSKHVPTWSWASIEGHIIYPPGGHFPIFASNCAKVEYADTSQQLGDAFLRAAPSTIITITGPVIVLTLSYKPNIQDTDGSPQIIFHFEDEHVIHQDFRGDYDYDHGGISDHIPDDLGSRSRRLWRRSILSSDDAELIHWRRPFWLRGVGIYTHPTPSRRRE